MRYTVTTDARIRTSVEASDPEMAAAAAEKAIESQHGVVGLKVVHVAEWDAKVNAKANRLN